MLLNCDNSAAQKARNQLGGRSAASAKNLNIEVADFLSQRVAVETQQIGRTDLVATRSRQSGGEQRIFYLAQYPMIQARRRQSIFEPCEIGGKVSLDRAREVFFAMRLLAAHRKGRLRQFRVNHRGGDCLLRIECGQSARQILKFAHIPGPAVPLKAIERGLVHLLRRQALTLGLRKEMPDEI